LVTEAPRSLALEQRDRFGVDRELLATRSADGGGLAAVEGDRVGRAVLVAVVVREPQPAGGAGQHPGAAAVAADMEGDLQLALGALAHVHDQDLAGEGILLLDGLVGDHAAGEGLAAVLGDGRQERVGRQRRDCRFAGILGPWTALPGTPGDQRGARDHDRPKGEGSHDLRPYRETGAHGR